MHIYIHRCAEVFTNRKKCAKETNNILTGDTPLIISQNVKSVNLKKELKYPIYLLL